MCLGCRAIRALARRFHCGAADGSFASIRTETNGRGSLCFAGRVNRPARATALQL